MRGQLSYINALLGVSLLVVSALAAREAVVLKYGGEAAIEAPPEKGKLSSLESPDYSPIVESGIFGKGRFEPRAAAGTADSGSLVLLGTAEGADLAIFMDMNTGKQRAFKKGESVFGAGELAEVGAKKAVLTFSNSRRSFSVRSSPIGGGNEVKPPAKEASIRGGDGRWEIDRKALSGVFDNMDKVLTDARFTPFVENGKLSGFRVSEIKPEGVFGMIGLQNGDVVMNINDYRLESPGRVAQVLTGLKGESEVKVDIVRGREPRTLRYRIR